MRLARTYEEVRGRDLEGFVGFLRDQESLGATQLEAVSEEESSGAVRLLTIHAAKGLEFKVVVVADAGRDLGGPPPADEILALADGRFGFKVVHPGSGERKAVFGYEEVLSAEREADRAERLRLYYVAMTRAKDRLLVSGAVGDSRETPIGWVLSKLECEEELAGNAEVFELQRDGASFLVRMDRAGAVAPELEDMLPEAGQLALFDEVPQAPRARGWVLPELMPLPVPGLHYVRQLSYSAIALFDRCSYRYYAERVGGLREQRPELPEATGGLAATEIGDAVHRLLELVDPRKPVAPDTDVVRAWYPAVGRDELERIAAFLHAYCSSPLASRLAALDGVRPERPFAFSHDGVLLHGRLDLLHRAGGRALVVDYKTNILGERTAEEVVESDYRLQRVVYAIACFRAGADEVEVVYSFLERPDGEVSMTFTSDDLPGLEAVLSSAIARIAAGEFVPTPSAFTCAGCPALDVVCAGPGLHGRPTGGPMAEPAGLAAA
jgi:ATP-dependent exoDNAse (exonuclease V) beta subunit